VKNSRVSFKRSFLFPLVSVLLILVMLLTVPACDNSVSPSTSETTSPDTSATTTNPPENMLSFEHIFTSRNTSVLEIPTKIYVMTSSDSPLPYPINDFWEYYDNKIPREEILDTIDFSRYFILLAFMGSQPVTGPNIEVKQIWQTDNIIYVEAYFDPAGPAFMDSLSSPYDVVKVSKDNMPQFGEITFILLDQNGEERARAVYDISQ
jgi:hypothetical protein